MPALLLPLQVIVRFFSRLFSSSVVLKNTLAFLAVSTITKAFTVLGIFAGTYVISNQTLDLGLNVVQSYIDDLSQNTGFIDSLIITDLIHTMKFIEALSVLFSAMTAAFVITSSRIFFSSKK